MANVFNWQIGREMDYPYEPSRPKRQFAMVMDLNKCIACQTCTVACKTNWTPGRGQEYMFWNNVESKPYGFYPLGWDVRILEKHGVQDLSGDVYKGKTLFEAAPEGERILGYLPEDIDYANPNVGEDNSWGTCRRATTSPSRICNGCTTCRASAITAHTRPVWAPARANRSISARRTGSCSLISHAAAAIASA